MTKEFPKGSLTRRGLLFGGLTLATAAGAGVLDLRKRALKPVEQPLSEALPIRMGQWVAADEGGIVRPTEAGERGIYDQEVSRVFTGPEQPGVMLLVAYGSTQSDTLQVHRPEFCYPAAGFAIQDAENVSQAVLPGMSIPATFFTAVRGERVEQVLYWVRLGAYFPSSWAQQHLVRIRNSLNGVIPDGILVRASVIDTDAVKSRALLSNFLQNLAVHSTSAGRLALIGRR